MTIKASRDRLLDRANVCENPGLLLSRYLREHDDQKSAQRKLYEQAIGAGIPSIYPLAYERRKRALDGVTFTGTVAGPLAIGLGNESVLENGLTLLHTYGVPYCPGSALKGLALRAAQRADLAPEAIVTLFGVGGTTEGGAAGYVTFHDAWYVPGSAPDDRPLVADTVTVHHPGYYRSEGTEAPTDSDDPNPVPFLAVALKLKFLFCLTAPDDAWGNLAFNVLTWGLVHLGLGGKSSAGYGAFVPKDFPRLA